MIEGRYLHEDEVARLVDAARAEGIMDGLQRAGDLLEQVTCPELPVTPGILAIWQRRIKTGLDSCAWNGQRLMHDGFNMGRNSAQGTIYREMERRGEHYHDRRLRLGRTLN